MRQLSCHRGVHHDHMVHDLLRHHFRVGFLQCPGRVVGGHDDDDVFSWCTAPPGVFYRDLFFEILPDG